MKVLFLDIDGVLNNDSTLERCGHFLGVERAISDKLVRWLDEHKDVSVVLSSTWRLHPWMHEHLHEAGIKWVDVTPDIGPRPVEILHWLQQHPDVTHWAALDDMDLSSLGANFVQTDFQYGLRDSDLAKLTELL